MNVNTVKMLKSVLICVIFIQVSGQNVKSPCPQYFGYRSDNSGVYGLLQIPSFETVQSVEIKISFTILAKLYSVS